MAAKGNDMRWKPGKRGHYEGYYIAFNDPESGRGYWIRYSMVAPTDAGRDCYAQVWFMRTNRDSAPRNRALRTTFGIDSLRTTTGPFTLAIDSNQLSMEGCAGSLADASGEVAWKLNFEALLPGITPTPEWGARMATCYMEPHPLLRLTGSISEGGVETQIDGWLGEQAHVFGARHSQRWHWAECKHLGGPGRAFTGVAAWPKLPGPPRSITSLYLELGDGRRLLKNTTLNLFKAETAHSPSAWEFEGEYGLQRLHGTISPHRADLIGVTYHDPSGQPIYCYHSELADLALSYFTRTSRSGPWKLEEEITAPAARPSNTAVSSPWRASRSCSTSSPGLD
jgi:hypothetical protein